MSGPARLVVLPENRSFAIAPPELSSINHGISARFDPKTTPITRNREQMLKLSFL
jgi:hypothetical protein